MVRIVIAGAGKAGLNAALALEKKFENRQGISITLVDRHDYHLLNKKLSVAAASDEEFADINKLKSDITLALEEVLSGKKINFIQGELLRVDSAQNKIHLHGKHLSYDYLILALGSDANLATVKGAKEHGLPLHSLADALRIKNALAFVAENRRLAQSSMSVRIVVAGGGAEGAEFAAELQGHLDFLAWKNELAKDSLEVVVYEAEHRLLPKYDYSLSQKAFWRLKNLGVRVETEKKIVSADKNFISFEDKEKIQYDVLVWMAGVVPSKIFIEQGHHQKGKAGDLLVNEHLQLFGSENIFVVGSQAGMNEITYNPKHQAEYLAYALPKLMKNKKPGEYLAKKQKLILKIGPSWAIAGNFTGYSGYLLYQLSHFNYLRRLVGFKEALYYLF